MRKQLGARPHLVTRSIEVAAERLERAAKMVREEGFRDREEKIINELTEKQGIVLATGGGSVKSRETRNRLSARGVVVYLETTIEKQLARTQRDKKRPLLQVETPPREVLEALAGERNPLYEEIADVTIRTDDQSAKVVANQIIHMLESN